MNQTQLPGRGRPRRRLLAAALTATLASGLAAVTAPSTAQAQVPCGEHYTVEQDLGRVHTAVESRIVENNTSGTVPVTLTSQVSQTISSTWSSSSTLGINIEVINLNVSQQLSISTTRSVTTQIGVMIGPIEVPAGNTLIGDWGVFRQKTQGTYSKRTCGGAGDTRPPKLAFGTAFSARGQGWVVFQV